MQFTRQSTRKGILKLGEYAINTPAISLPTNLYSVPYLTRDMFDQVLDPSRTILEVHYEDILENIDILRNIPMPFKKYSNLDGYAMWLSLRETKYFENAEEFKHLNSDDRVSCVHHGGLVKLPIALIKEMKEKIRPEAIIAPVDHFKLPGTEKRKRTSVARTVKYASELQNVPGLVRSFISYEGLSQNQDSIIALSGIEKGSLSSPEFLEKFSTVLGDKRPAIYWRGSYDLQSALQLILRGQLDILDGTSILAMSAQGIALQLPTGDFDVSSLTINTIDLFDKQFETDTSKLCDGCPCPGCQFMKSYVHHLFIVHEILGPAALTTHNLFQVLQLLSKI